MFDADHYEAFDCISPKPQSWIEALAWMVSEGETDASICAVPFEAANVADELLRKTHQRAGIFGVAPHQPWFELTQIWFDRLKDQWERKEPASGDIVKFFHTLAAAAQSADRIEANEAKDLVAKWDAQQGKIGERRPSRFDAFEKFVPF